MKNVVLILCSLCLLSLHLTAQTKRVLFVGNSYIYVNDLPGMLKSMALSTNDTFITDQSTPGGYTFEQHSTDANTLAKIQQGNWNYVVMQEQSQRPSFPLSQVQSQVFPFAKTLDSLVNVYNSCAETVYYMTWGRKNGDASNCANFPPLCTYSGMDSLLRLRYDFMATSNKGTVAPAGPIWRYIRNNHASIELYSPDESHPSIAGTYAAACGFYTSILRKDPTLISFVPAGLSAADALTIRNAAKKVAFDSMATWYIKEYDAKSDFNYSKVGALGINCTNSSSNATSYTWYFGDGQSSNSATATHTYANSGVYTITLVASNCFSKDSSFKVINLDGTSITPLHKIELSIFPNPATDKITFANQNFVNPNVSIITVEGKTLATTFQKIGSQIVVDIKHLSAGNYFLRMSDEKYFGAVPFLKQ